MPTLLVIHHSPTVNTRCLSDALIEGAHDELIEGVDVQALAPTSVDAAAINAADGVVIVSPANFGYMAGLIKDLFDRTFLDIGGALSADGSAASTTTGRKPYAVCVHGRYDTEGAVLSIERIVSALPWQRAANPLAVIGPVDQLARDSAYELGASMAALLT